MCPITTVYYKEQLDNHDQKVYDDLMYKWMHYHQTINIAKPHAELQKIVKAIQWDMPLMFYVNYFSVQYCAYPSEISINAGYFFSKEEAKELLAKCYEWGNYFVKKMPPNLTVQQRALWLHDVIINNVEYGNNSSFRGHCIIGVIKDKIAVCEGIARTYKFLCDLSGIPCAYVNGFFDGERHGWNMVWIDGEPSFVDVTHDLRKGNFMGTRLNFLRSSDEMYNYTWDKSSIPECRLKNKLDISVVAHSKMEFIANVRKMPKTGSISIFLDFGRQLSQQEIESLIREMCTFNSHLLVNKKTGYSLPAQTIYITD